MPLLPGEERAEDQAGVGVAGPLGYKRLVRWVPLLLVVLIGAGSLLFDLTLSSRLPSDADWAEAAGALRARGQAGDAVQVWPPWAERARLFVDALPLFLEEDLAQADYLGVQRLWILSLRRAPRFAAPDDALRSRGATPVAEAQRFGALSLRAWDLHPAPLAADLTRATEDHEVDYLARRCLRVAIGSRFAARGAGRTLHLRAGVIGERAYDADRPAVEVQAFADGAPAGVLEVPRTERDGTGWRRLEVALPAPPATSAPEAFDSVRDFVFAVSSADASRPFCLAAWTTR